MNTKQRTLAIFILALSLVMTGCGPGQFLGPTVTPSPTSTPMPTSTPTPIPVETILLANGLKLSPEDSCSDGPCKVYINEDLLMKAIYYDDGSFMFVRILFTADINMKQGPIEIKIFNSLYPADVADAALGGQAKQPDGKTKLPYNGEINGYEYSAYAESTGVKDLSGNDIIKMVIIVKPIH